jgi:hypothetical protein
MTKGAWLQPSDSRESAISSAPSGSPWALAVLARLGEPLPMCVLQMTSEGALGLLVRLGDGGSHLVGVMPVDGADHVPAAGHEAQRGVVDEPGLHGPSMLMPLSSYSAISLFSFQAPASEGLVADALHQAAVAQEGVGVVVHHGVAFAVELGRQQLLGQRHAHGVGDALAQRAGGGFHAGGVAHLGVAAVRLCSWRKFCSSCMGRS